MPDIDSCPIGQYGGKYILLPSANGLMLIHQHRAHMAVLYAQFLEQLQHAQGAMQQLLFPEVMELTQDEMVLVQTILQDLHAIGFDMAQFSPTSYSIQAIPAQLTNGAVIPTLQDIVRRVRERGADTQTEWREQIAMSLAQSAAIPYGKALSEDEMRDLVRRLMQLPQYGRTADGKTIMTLLTNEEIDKRF